MNKNKNTAGATKAKRKPGRPQKYDWASVMKKQMFRSRNDTEIAKFLGCTVANVTNRRRKLLADAQERGISTVHLIPGKGVKFRRTVAKAEGEGGVTELENAVQDSPDKSEQG